MATGIQVIAADEECSEKETQPYEAEWGNMLRIAKDSLNRAPACTWLGPGLAITLTVLGFSLLGDGLRDAVEARSGEP